MSKADGEKSGELVEILHQLHKRLGKPDTISFLDRGIRLSWRATTTRLVRYAKIPVDPELLHYLSGPSGSSSKVDLYIYGDELTIKGPWGEIRSRIDDLASTCEGLGRGD